MLCNLSAADGLCKHPANVGELHCSVGSLRCASRIFPKILPGAFPPSRKLWYIVRVVMLPCP